MIPDRSAYIRTYLFEHGQTSVVRLAEIVGTSVATIRRDLTEMEQAGLLERLHGTARIAPGARGEVAFAARESTNLAAKRAIASAAYAAIQPGTTILLDAGTTVLQLARRIKLMPLPDTVFTNGLAVAQELADVPGVTLCLLGGRLRAENNSMIGPLAETMLDQLWFDRLFLGVSALSDDGAISSFDADEARANARMLARSARAVILADHGKFSQRATYAVAQLCGDEMLITDRPLTGDLAEHARRIGLATTVAAPDFGGPRA